jgi:hypothetical protein
MGNPVVSRKIIHGIIPYQFADQIVDNVVLLIGQEHRARVGADLVDVKCPLPLLVRPGKFMLLDQSRFIFPNTDRGNNAVLDVIAHLLTVNIVNGFFFPEQDLIGQELLKVSPGRFKDLGLIDVRIAGNVDLRLLNMEETDRIGPADGPGLLRVEDIIGKGRD